MRHPCPPVIAGPALLAIFFAFRTNKVYILALNCGVIGRHPVNGAGRDCYVCGVMKNKPTSGVGVYFDIRFFFAMISL